MRIIPSPMGGLGLTKFTLDQETAYSTHMFPRILTFVATDAEILDAFKAYLKMRAKLRREYKFVDPGMA